MLRAGGLADQSGKLSDVTSSDLAATLPDGAESLQVVRATKQFGDRVTPAIVVYQRAADSVLAERLNTTRGALYKTVHDARHKLRRALARSGLAATADTEDSS